MIAEANSAGNFGDGSPDDSGVLSKPFVPPEPVYLSSVSVYLPPQVISNEEFVRRSGLLTGAQTRAQWIEARTGIKERRWAREDESCSTMALAAARAIPDLSARVARREIGQMVLATISGDFPSPPTGPLLQEALSQAGVLLRGTATFDLGAACAGFVSGLMQAAILSSVLKNDTLLVASDIRSKFLNLKDYNTAPLFGDAAAAGIVSLRGYSAPGFRLIAAQTFTDGAYARLILIPGGGSAAALTEPIDGRFPLTIMDGAKIFLKAREAFTEGSRRFLSGIGYEFDRVKYLVPHQANALILREVKRDLGLSDSQVIETVSWTGNTSGASVGVALYELQRRDILVDGDLILLASAGGGGIVAHALLEFRSNCA